MVIKIVIMIMIKMVILIMMMMVSVMMMTMILAPGETKDLEIEKKGVEIQALTSTLETAKV